MNRLFSGGPPAIAVPRMPRAEVRRRIAAVQEAYPDLTSFGFGVYAPRRLTEAERTAELAAGRLDMFSDDSMGEFVRARAWLDRQPRTKGVNPRAGSSYGLKHEAEAAVGYISNGALIAAAIDLGFVLRRCAPDSPNAWLSLSPRRAPTRAHYRPAPTCDVFLDDLDAMF